MESNPVIFDISSDEEAAFDEPRGGDDDHDWLTELLQTVDKEIASSDEVIVVGEYNPPKPKSKSKSSKPVKDVEDDDCVVLDGDPDAQVDVVDDTASDGDDVLVVGQKGQVACRDYPHPRHLCAKFPFSSTPHERHCDLCHCYVCDSIAPCAHWGTGVSKIDHCHATDKQEIWKSQRENFRLGKRASLPISKFTDVQLPGAASQLNQVAPLDFIQLAPNLVSQNQLSRPTTIRACSSARLNTPNIISQSRNKRPRFAQGRNGLLPPSVSQQAGSICNTAIVRNRGQQFVSSNTMFKRPGIRGTFAMEQSICGSVNKKNCAPASHYARNAVSTATANAQIPSRWQDALPNMIPHTYTYRNPSQPNMGSATLNVVPSRPEEYSQPIPQSIGAQNIYQNQSQTGINSSFPDFDFDLISNFSESNQQVSAEINHPHGPGSNKEPTADKQFISQLAESTELYEDYDYERWLLGQSDAAVSEDCVPVDLNLFSCEPCAFDAERKREMALWLETGSEPKTDSEIADLQAIAAIKESAALELKEQGNKYVKMGKKHYSDAIDCYTRAINQKVLSDSENSIIYSNRAHVNLSLGNYRRALEDAEEAIKLCSTNVKALYRASKASLSLNLLDEAKSYSESGLKQDPNNEELKKLAKQINSLKMERDKHEAEVSKAVSDAKDLLSAIDARGLKIGKAMFRELVGLKKPVLDKSKIIHWPILLLYAEVMSSDFIEDFCETDMFSTHLDMMFSESCPPLPWDTENNYTREAVELYYEAGSTACLSKSKILHYLLEGTVGANAEIVGEEKDTNEDSIEGTGSSKWVKVNEKKTLHEVLKERNFVIPGIPVFYVVSRNSNFYRKFKAGKWALPP